jgi:hypothetical protein
MAAREQHDSSDKCPYHEGHAIILDRLERGHDAMDKRVSVLEERSYSPAVIVAFLGLIGTAVTAAGGVLSAVLVLVAKSQGWM